MYTTSIPYMRHLFWKIVENIDIYLFPGKEEKKSFLYIHLLPIKIFFKKKKRSRKENKFIGQN